MHIKLLLHAAGGDVRSFVVCAVYSNTAPKHSMLLGVMGGAGHTNKVGIIGDAVHTIT